MKFIPILLITIVPISVYIVWKVKKKHYTDGDVSDRQQRKSLYIFMVGSIMVYLAFVYARFKEIDFVLFFLLVLLLAMMVSNYFIKSSMPIALNIFVAALLFTIDPIFGMIWMVCAVLVGISRIILKKHTIKEVTSGVFIALIVYFIYLYTHIQTIN